MFSFFNELDILEERFEYLFHKVDYFVICESDRTHVGNQKPLYFFENIHRFEKYKEKIIHLIFYGNSPIDNPWINENNQRNYILSQINFKDEDKLLISDVDEIPSHLFINELIKYKGSDLLIAVQELSFFWPNYRRNDLPYWIGGTRGFNYKYLNQLRNLNENFSSTFLFKYNQGTTLTKVRLTNIGIPISNGGWHLSYMGGRESIKSKILSFAHIEEKERIGYNIEKFIDNFISKERNFFGKDEFYVSYGTFNNQILLNEPNKYFKLTNTLKFIWVISKIRLVLKIKIKYYVKMLLSF